MPFSREDARPLLTVPQHQPLTPQIRTHLREMLLSPPIHDAREAQSGALSQCDLAGEWLTSSRQEVLPPALLRSPSSLPVPACVSWAHPGPFHPLLLASTRHQLMPDLLILPHLLLPLSSFILMLLPPPPAHPLFGTPLHSPSRGLPGLARSGGGSRSLV